MSKTIRIRTLGLVAGLLAATAVPGTADLSGFVGTVGFENDLERSLGFGLRWGRSSGILGGETALMIANPTRDLDGTKSTATAIFYEARILVNVPVGRISPFAGIGFGQIILTSTDVPHSVGEDAMRDAFKEASKLQVSNAFSYGGGARYGLNDRLDLRADLRQYIVFSVTGLAKDAMTQRAEDAIGVDLPVEESTVSYEEISVGINFRF